jgi:hypothetical protein
VHGDNSACGYLDLLISSHLLSSLSFVFRSLDGNIHRSYDVIGIASVWLEDAYNGRVYWISQP